MNAFNFKWDEVAYKKLAFCCCVLFKDSLSNKVIIMDLLIIVLQNGIVYNCFTFTGNGLSSCNEGKSKSMLGKNARVPGLCLNIVETADLMTYVLAVRLSSTRCKTSCSVCGEWARRSIFSTVTVIWCIHLSRTLDCEFLLVELWISSQKWFFKFVGNKINSFGVSVVNQTWLKLISMHVSAWNSPLNGTFLQTMVQFGWQQHDTKSVGKVTFRLKTYQKSVFHPQWS